MGNCRSVDGTSIQKTDCAPQPQRVSADDDICMILIGPPGSGKGSYATKLVERLDIPHLSTADMLRAAMVGQTEAGKQAQNMIEANKSVSDEIVNSIVAESLQSDACVNGFILDGYPRTVSQAKFLDKVLHENGDRKLTHILYLDATDQALKDRILGRLIHRASGRVYHTKYKPPIQEMKDDVTGESLHRECNETEESLNERLAEFYQVTSAVIDYYTKKHKKAVFKINADCKLPSIWNDVELEDQEPVQRMFES